MAILEKLLSEGGLWEGRGEPAGSVTRPARQGANPAPAAACRGSTASGSAGLGAEDMLQVLPFLPRLAAESTAVVEANLELCLTDMSTAVCLNKGAFVYRWANFTLMALKHNPKIFPRQDLSVSRLDGVLSTGFYSAILIVRYMAPSTIYCTASKLGAEYRCICLLVGVSAVLFTPML